MAIEITALTNGSTSEFGPSVMVGTYQGNLAPQVSITAPPTSTAGVPVVLTGNITDDDSVRWTVMANMGDGTAPIPVFVADDHTFQLSYNYKNTGNYTVSILVTDNGGQTSSASTNIAIVNSAPEVTPEALRVTSSIVEGDLATVTGSFSDNDLQPGHNILVDFGDGAPPVTATVNTSNRTFQASYRYRDDGISRTPVDVYRIAVTVTDPNGASTSSPLVRW